MAASTLVTTTFSNDTDAHFRTWVAAIIAAIIAGGWTQTGDTGQINTATVTAPVATTTVAGYAMFSSNDSGGGLVNFYFKIEFGSGGVSATRPSVWITFGFQGTDGAGNLLSTINPISTRAVVASGTTPGGLSLNINFASGSGYFVMAVIGTVSENIFFGVERTKDSNLAAMNQINIFSSVGGAFSTSGGQAFCQVLNTLNRFPDAQVINVAVNAVIAPNANTPVAGVVALGLFFGLAPGATSPSLNLFGVESAALGVAQDIITVSVLSVNHNYKLQQGITFAGQAGTVLMTRYE